MKNRGQEEGGIYEVGKKEIGRPYIIPAKDLFDSIHEGEVLLIPTRLG